MFIAITAYGNPNNTFDQVVNMYSADNYYSIHWNKRDKRSYSQLKSLFSEYKNVHIFTKYKVYWGHSSIVYAMDEHIKIFLKTNEKIFLHICNKTVSIKNITDTEHCIEQLLKNGYNFFDYNRSFLKYMPRKIFDHYEYTLKMFMETKFWLLRWNHKVSYCHPPRFKIDLTFLVIKLFFIHPFKIIQAIAEFLSKNGGNMFQIIQRKFYLHLDDDFFQKSLLINKKLNKVPKALNSWRFVMNTQIGPFLCLQRDELITMIHSKEYKVLMKFIKNAIFPDEWFFPNLYYNFFRHSNDLSTVISLDVDWKQDEPFCWNQILQDICFLRKVQGMNEIEVLNAKLIS